MRQKMEEMIWREQDAICAVLAKLDGKGFQEDSWQRPGGGGGRSRILEGGKVFERAGVNVSVVHGVLAPEAGKVMRGIASEPAADGPSFYAAGISIVIHPLNPFAPTAHANYRYFERGDGKSAGSWWFGGGADLTPSYLFEEDARHFHRTLKGACDAHDGAFYPRFKKGCDDYFFIRHRGETRGVGGIFFDDLHDRAALSLFAFVRDCAAAFIPSYLPVVERRMNTPFGARHRRWQELRHGRYVEFNLTYDRGTTFGLSTGARAESILMSLPATARWEHCPDPETGTAEGRLVSVLRAPRDWV